MKKKNKGHCWQMMRMRMKENEEKEVLSPVVVEGAGRGGFVN
jgi:hypothetical protein